MASNDGRRLYLFDIDGTLLDTGGAGLHALRKALPDAFPTFTEEDMPELDLAGSTDSGLVMEIFRTCDIHDTPANRDCYFAAYLRHLRSNLAEVGERARLLPGVAALLSALINTGTRPHATGLLTGNIREGAAIKVRHCAIADHFGFGAYGDDHHDRNALGPIVRDRAARYLDASIDVAGSVVIGDTPKDIRCGKALGARTLAVATGKFTAEELRGFGADAVFETLEDTESVLSALDWTA
jgi:phosphoglycolate phosphatase